MGAGVHYKTSVQGTRNEITDGETFHTCLYIYISKLPNKGLFNYCAVSNDCDAGSKDQIESTVIKDYI